MIRFLLRAIEVFHNPLFTERELMNRSRDGFKDLLSRKILYYYRAPGIPCERLKSPHCSLCGSTLTAIWVGDEYVGICPHHPNGPPIPVKKEDLFTYAVSIEDLLDQIRSANNIDGQRNRINGFQYLGHKTYGECRVGFVFIRRMGKNKVVNFTGLKHICEEDHILIVLTPASEVDDVAMKGMLENEKIVQTSLISSLNPETFDLPVERLSSGFLEAGKGQEVTEQQRQDYEKYEYLCYDKIHIPGKIPMKRSNLIYVNENTVKIGDSLFALLLRLVVELKKGNGGWLDIHTLHSEGIISDPGKYQIYSRLRNAMAGSLLEKDGKKFIESDGVKRYRISSHPDFIINHIEELP